MAETLAVLPDDPSAAGGAWLAAGRGPLLRASSVLVPHAWRFLVNPRHAVVGEIVRQQPFGSDRRLWAPLDPSPPRT